MDRGRFYLYAGLGGLAAAVFAYAAYLRQALAISAGFDAAADLYRREQRRRRARPRSAALPKRVVSR